MTVDININCFSYLNTEWQIRAFLLRNVKIFKNKTIILIYLLDLRLILAARALLEHLAYFSATSCLSAFSFIIVPVEYPEWVENIYLDQNPQYRNTLLPDHGQMDLLTLSPHSAQKQKQSQKISMPCAFDILVPNFN